VRVWLRQTTSRLGDGNRESEERELAAGGSVYQTLQRDNIATFSVFYVAYCPSLKYSHITLSSDDVSMALP